MRYPTVESVLAANFLYHCTREDRADAIEQSGYHASISLPYLEQFQDHTGFIEALSAMLGNPQGLSDQDIMERWVDKFGHGCLLWVSTDSPDPTYGKGCFTVQLPPDARLAYQDAVMHHQAYWIPQQHIDQKHFTRI